MPADLIAAIGTLVVAQVFLFGFLLQRLDSVLDQGKARIDAARRRLQRAPGTPLPLGYAAADALGCREMVDSELRRSHARAVYALLPALAVVFSYLGLSSVFDEGDPLRWFTNFEPIPARWNADATSFVVLMALIAGLAAFSSSRTRRTRVQLREYYRAQGIAAVGTAHTAVVGVGEGEYPTAQEGVDEAISALARLSDVWPGWEWTAGLHGDFWFWVSQVGELQTAVSVDAGEALERSLGEYERALAVDDNLDLRLRRARILSLLADREAGPTAKRLRGIALADCYAAESDAETSTRARLAATALLMEMSAGNISRLLTSDYVGQIEAIYARGLADQHLQPDLVLSWVDWQLHGAGSASRQEIATCLVGLLRRLAMALRAARDDLEASSHAVRALEALRWLASLNAHLVAKESLLGLGVPQALGELATSVNDRSALRRIRLASAYGSDSYVLAQGAYLANAGNVRGPISLVWSLARPYWSRLVYPVRRERRVTLDLKDAVNFTLASANALSRYAITTVAQRPKALARRGARRTVLGGFDLRVAISRGARRVGPVKVLAIALTLLAAACLGVLAART